MPKIQDITRVLEQTAPRLYQESYDNAGLIVGNPAQEVTKVLLALDSTEAVVEEAIAKGCQLIIAHHPIVFRGLKQLNGKNYVERTVLKAIKNDIALYAIHTNLDNVKGGVNYQIAQKLGLKNVRILAPKSQTLQKLTVFVPQDNTPALIQALGEAGAGQIGNYEDCSFRSTGTGTFRPNEAANPHIGEAGGALEEVQEDRVEVIFPMHLQGKVLSAMRQAHPYEEVAYYLHQLENQNQDIGSGAIGELPEALGSQDFLAYLQKSMNLACIRHTALLESSIKKVAICGGAGSFLLKSAIGQGAQAFVSADFKYHEFFDAEDKLMICDIGHYESEVFTKNLLQDLLKPVFPDLDLVLCDRNTNPVHYFTGV